MSKKKRCLIFLITKEMKLSHLLTFTYKVSQILLFIIFKRACQS